MNFIAIGCLFICFLSKSNGFGYQRAVDLNDYEKARCTASECTLAKSEISPGHMKLNLRRCKKCEFKYQKCVKFRTCLTNCIHRIDFVSYRQDYNSRGAYPRDLYLNPCLEYILTCNYDTAGRAYIFFAANNPHLFI